MTYAVNLALLTIYVVSQVNLDVTNESRKFVKKKKCRVGKIAFKKTRLLIFSSASR
jgi:hypothetical protein